LRERLIDLSPDGQYQIALTENLLCELDPLLHQVVISPESKSAASLFANASRRKSTVGSPVGAIINPDKQLQLRLRLLRGDRNEPGKRLCWIAAIEKELGHTLKGGGQASVDAKKGEQMTRNEATDEPFNS